MVTGQSLNDSRSECLAPLSPLPKGGEGRNARLRRFSKT